MADTNQPKWKLFSSNEFEFDRQMIELFCHSGRLDEDILFSLLFYSFISRAPVTSSEVLSLGALEHTTFIHKMHTHYDENINTAVNGSIVDKNHSCSL